MWPDRGIIHAIGAAALFGLSTPLAKIAIGEIKPFMLAGLLYAGSGLGLLAVIALKKRFAKGGVSMEAPLKRADWPWLLGATFFGGFLGPLFLVFGLCGTPAASASLLLNLEGVFTALIAWFVFKENFDGRIAFGMALITAGCAALSWQGGPESFASLTGPMAIAVACLSWAIDNNLTKKISGGDPFHISCVKGLIAGSTNLAISLFILKISLPAAALILKAFVIGFFGYGLSLVLFVLALRGIGTSRTGAYFSMAPFFGAIASLLIFRQMPDTAFITAFMLMAGGVYCHLSESHDHGHKHEYIMHEHTHYHDDMHHDHDHQEGRFDATTAAEPHSHPHEHHPLFHTHFHYPDIHHEHTHDRA